MTMPARGGPYVKGAFLCERIIEGKDGTNSYISVADRITVGSEVIRIGTPPEGILAVTAPETIPDGTIADTWGVIMLVAGGAKGRHVVRMRVRRPDGTLHDYGGPIDVHFDERPSSGVNLHIRMRFVNLSEGNYEVIVLVDEQEKTRILFDVIYQRKG